MATASSTTPGLHGMSSATPRHRDPLVTYHSWSPRRFPRATHWTANETVDEKQPGREERIDSAFEPWEPLKDENSKSQDTFLHKLPQPVRGAIYSYAFTDDGPVHPRLSAGSSHEKAKLCDPPLAHALPSLHAEISRHLPQHLHTNTFAFDLRTASGAAIFIAFASSLGPYASHIQSLALTHWTAWWGFGTSSWKTATDTTTLTRSASGTLVAIRCAETPACETCTCDLLALLKLHDSEFKPERYKGIRSVRQFADCLRHPYRHPWPFALLEVGKLVAGMLEKGSRELARHYGIAGSLCQRCDMPKLYLCGHASTLRQDVDSEEAAFCPVSAASGGRPRSAMW